MKKLLTLLLILALLLPVFGCDGTVPPETAPSTQPTDAQAAVPTTTPTEPPATSEVTVPPTTDEPASSGNLNQEPWGIQLTQDVLDALSFSQLAVTSSYSYRYTGSSPLIHLPYGDVSILLPEEWIENSEILWYHSRENRPWYLHINSTDLLYTWIAYKEDVDVTHVDDRLVRRYIGDFPYILILCGIPYEDTSTVMDERGYLGRDENFRYYFTVPEFWEDWWYNWRYREDMMDALGEDTCNALLNGMVITEEMAREMITITGLIEE